MTEPRAVGAHTETPEVSSEYHETFFNHDSKSTGTGCPGSLPCLEIFRSHLDMVPENLLQVNLLEQWGWATWPEKVPSTLKYSMILKFNRP